MRLLSDLEFQATFSSRMSRVEADGIPPLDVWPYFEAIPPLDFGGYDCSEGSVDTVYRDGSGRFEHILVSSLDPNVFMVLVVDLHAKQVFGHHLLNLRILYGLDDQGEC